MPEMIPPITPFWWSLAVVIQSAPSIRSTKLTGSRSCLNGIVSLAPFLHNYPDATGGIFDVQEDVSLDDLPDSYKRFLVSLGADNIPLDAPVPEPSALSLLLIGCLSLLGSRRRARALTEAKSFKLAPRW